MGQNRTGKDPTQKIAKYAIHLLPETDVINVADNNHLALDVVAVAFTPEGKRAGQPIAQRVDARLSAEKLAAIQKQGLVFRDALPLAPGDYKIRFVVRDDFTGRVGSLAAPLKVE